ncbi:MAG: prolipoprotein diacylglyceryl transferase [Desulfobulbaceae bacterium]|nr:prolipoprotein diacylglyceryl transferase [Desulfobulbaceae bacterium]
MIPYPNIDPVILHLGPLQVRWYGLMYVLGFLAAYSLIRLQINRYELRPLARHFENLNLCLIISLILGARLGYVLFYNLSYYLENPQEIMATWLGGMSFHGALLGLLLGGFIFCRLTRLPFLQTADVYIVTTPIGLGLGRIGNFINGELYGRVSDVPWAMVFPGGGPNPRHPSQLYECLLEGVLLFIILWSAKNRYWQRNWPTGSLLAIFLICYGLFRALVELFRQPDPQIGFIFGALTMGQILSGLMILAGIIILAIRRKSVPAP